MTKTYDERLERATYVWCKINNVYALEFIVSDEMLEQIRECVSKYIKEEELIEEMEVEMDQRGLVYPYD